jgi:hypothetical protein
VVDEVEEVAEDVGRAEVLLAAVLIELRSINARLDASEPGRRR